MEKVKVGVKNTSDLPLPEYQTLLSAGLDLMSTESLVLPPNESILVGTGLHIELPIGYEAQVRPRSGLAAKHSISIVNSPGTIDADYRGEIKVILINHGKEPFSIVKGDRIAQLVLNKIAQADFELKENLDETDRGQGGFGSTGL